MNKEEILWFIEELGRIGICILGGILLVVTLPIWILPASIYWIVKNY